MDVQLTLEGSPVVGELDSLRSWLAGVPELRGRTSPVERQVAGTMGSVMEALAVALGPGGLATGLATALFAWIRQQRAEVTVKVTRPDGTTLDLSAKRVQGLTQEALRELLRDTVRMLDATEPPAQREVAVPNPVNEADGR
ncbi:hypothetical protein ABTY61_37360 [Kitasatospora sp. NPDC096128]|uniref:effector-associated constant component EACC1 n=1 Tax=Kitasatospora sp. NPDC096128 TaxID=3155547 RepID=UPI00331695E6